MIVQFGNPQFTNTNFGSGSAGLNNYAAGNIVVCLGDPSNHGGYVSDTGGNTGVKCNGILIAEDQASHSCPIIGHGVTPITAIIIKKYVNGKLILTFGSQAGCGAVIQPSRFRKVLTN